MELSDNVTVEEYFEEYVPEFFSERLSKAQIQGMEGTEFTLQFDVSGRELKTYAILVKDARELKVEKGGVEKPMVRIELSEDLWRDAVTGKISGAIEMFTDVERISTRSGFDQLKEISGTLELELTTEDGRVIQLKIVFNGADSPHAKFSSSLEDWGAITRGELPGVTAFMTNRLKIEGDMAFAMALGALVG